MTEFEPRDIPPRISTTIIPENAIPFVGPIAQKKRLWNMLASSVPSTDYVIPTGRATEILDLACGDFVEAPVLQAYFAGKAFTTVRITGIDSDKRFEAREGEGYQFIQGDASRLDDYAQVPLEADVLVVRHPQLGVSDQAVWKRIFEQGLARLRPEGICLATAYTSFGREKLESLLQELGCTVVINKENPYADRSVNNPADHYVLVAKKVKS